MTSVDRLVQSFQKQFGSEPDLISRAPGRVDLIGAHVDYNDGLVLPAAITRYSWVAARPRSDSVVQVFSLDWNQRICFDVTNLDAKVDADGRSLPEWALYAAGVAWALGQRGISLLGCELAVTGDIPVGAGMSSSASVEVAYALVWLQMASAELPSMQIAQACQQAENAYVGVNSGLMDQFSSVFGREDHALLLDCRSLDWEALPLDSSVALVAADTGTRRTLTTAHYNTRRAECEQAVRSLQTVMRGITALRDVSIEEFSTHAERIPEPARQRAQHVIEEINRVRQAAGALRQGDTATLGRLMDASHISSRDLYDASGPELDVMWEASQGHPARLGGRFLGAGWAGCLIFLVNAAGAQDFATTTAQKYEKVTGNNAKVYLIRAAQGAQIIETSA
jgi:galactokinase